MVVFPYAYQFRTILNRISVFKIIQINNNNKKNAKYDDLAAGS